MPFLLLFHQQLSTDLSIRLLWKLKIASFAFSLDLDERIFKQQQEEEEKKRQRREKKKEKKVIAIVSVCF
jgi:U4/U6.U5 tri-snRNP component SNU23